LIVIFFCFVFIRFAYEIFYLAFACIFLCRFALVIVICLGVL